MKIKWSAKRFIKNLPELLCYLIFGLVILGIAWVVISHIECIIKNVNLSGDVNYWKYNFYKVLELVYNK